MNDFSDEFECEVKQNVKAFEEHQSKMNVHLFVLNKKLINATKLHEQMKSIENHREYIDEVGIEKECEKTAELIESALKIKVLISDLESDPNYLNEGQIKVLDDHVRCFFLTCCVSFQTSIK